MSILSSAMGAILPSLLPKRWTTIAASLLFWVFGIRMLYEGWHMEGGNEAMEEEMREVQKEVELAEMEVGGGAPGRTRGSQVDLESGIMEEEEGRSPNTPGGASSRPRSPFMNGGGVSPGSSSNIPERKRRRSSLQLPPFPDISQSLPASARKAASDTLRQGVKTFSEGAKNLCQLFFSPILIQAFILTFLAEWGDRSQITTIALAAAHVSSYGTRRDVTSTCSTLEIFAERIPRHPRNRIGTRLLHLPSRHRRTLAGHQDFREAW